MRWAAVLACALAVAVPLPGQGRAQDSDPLNTFEPGRVQSPILTVDSDRLFLESAWGRRVFAEVQAETEAFNAENRRLEAALTEEERSLTERRPTMEVEDFRAEAEAFDTKVQAIRAAQDAKQRNLQQLLTRGREGFLNEATPILARLMLESGAAVIVDRRSVILSAGAIDITDAAIAAIDAAIGDGEGLDRGAEDAPD
jgi:Skp family chaperone for outer membrane proteins